MHKFDSKRLEGKVLDFAIVVAIPKPIVEIAIFIPAKATGHKGALKWCSWLYLCKDEVVLSSCFVGPVASIRW